MKQDVIRRTASVSARIAALKARKDRLDSEIDDEHARPAPDQLHLRRLKARRLAIRDEMTRYNGLLRTLKPLAGHATARPPGAAMLTPRDFLIGSRLFHSRNVEELAEALAQDPPATRPAPPRQPPRGAEIRELRPRLHPATPQPPGRGRT